MFVMQMNRFRSYEINCRTKRACVSLNLTSCFCLVRYGEPWGAWPGGARLQDALPGRVPHFFAWAHAFLLEEGPRGETYLWVSAGLPRGLLHLHRTSVSAWGEPIELHAEPSLNQKWGLCSEWSALTDLRRRIWACETILRNFFSGSKTEMETRKRCPACCKRTATENGERLFCKDSKFA